jgi:hypothetical protein
VPTVKPATLLKPLIIGNRDALASSGASSTIVYIISGNVSEVIMIKPVKN